MRRSTTVLRFLCTLAAGGLMLSCANEPTATDNAGGPAFGRYNDGGATIWLPDPYRCAVVDGSGLLVVTPDCRMQVETPSENGNVTVVVKASGVPNTTGRTVHWGPDNPGAQWRGLFYLFFGVTTPPYPCGVRVGPGNTYFVDILFTVDWQATVTPSGQATVTCHYRDDLAWFPF